MKPVQEYTNVDDLRQLIINAKRLNRTDVVEAAFRRICEIEGANYQDSLEREFYAGLAAYEELLREKHGRKQPAARTRQKLRNKTIVECMEDWARAKRPSEGFKTLMERGMPELTAEYLVCRFSDRFSVVAVKSANERLLAYGVTPP